MAPRSSTLPGKSHGRRSLVGCSPWGHEESDMTEWLHFHFSLLCIGEGNVIPLHWSCLENPRDGGTWWAAVYGVAQSQTRLKWLSSSSSSSSPQGLKASLPFVSAELQSFFFFWLIHSFIQPFSIDQCQVLCWSLGIVRKIDIKWILIIAIKIRAGDLVVTDY